MKGQLPLGILVMWCTGAVQDPHGNGWLSCRQGSQHQCMDTQLDLKHTCPMGIPKAHSLGPKNDWTEPLIRYDQPYFIWFYPKRAMTWIVFSQTYRNKFIICCFVQIWANLEIAKFYVTIHERQPSWIIMLSGRRSRTWGFVASSDPAWSTYKKLWKITMFNGKINYKWPCSIAMLGYQRVFNVAMGKLMKMAHRNRWSTL